jgi:hypothetical protein
MERQTCELCEGQESEHASEIQPHPPLYLAAMRGNLTIVNLLLAYNVTSKHSHDYWDVI